MARTLKTISTPPIAAQASDISAERSQPNFIFTSGDSEILKRDDSDRRFWIVDFDDQTRLAAQAKDSKTLPIGFEIARAKGMRRLAKRKAQKESAKADLFMAAANAAKFSEVSA